MRIGIFVATMTGLADVCGEEIEGALAKVGFPAERVQMDGLNPIAFDPYDLIVIVSSTYGHGEIPDNGLALYEALDAGVDLAGKDFTVFGLGDRTYADTFCAAGEKWDRAMAASGARRLIDLERHDASSGTLAEDVAAAWAADWATKLATGAHGSGSSWLDISPQSAAGCLANAPNPAIIA